MPNCPVCGKEVQASTTYCPACGANLRQGSAQPTMPAGSYTPNYSYPTSGGVAEQHHGHKKYIVAIVVVGIIGLIVGGLITSAFLIGPDVTDVTGTVALNGVIKNQYHGTASNILFGSASTGNLSSTIFPDQSYQTYLPIGETYTVIVQWTNITVGGMITYSCAASPGMFSSSSPNATQNFSC